MNILVTGGGGFLGSGMAETLCKNGHHLRLMDRSPFETGHEYFQGDVSCLDDVRRALADMDAVVISHMAPRTPDAYITPEVCFRINVTGTANILFAAQEPGIRKIVIISTTSPKPKDPSTWLATIPLPASAGLYGLTKECQETLGSHYAREHGRQITMLRVGYIVNADEMKDKYGRVVGERNAGDTDRRDVGEVAWLCLKQDHNGLQVLSVMSTHDSMDEWGAQHTADRLNWQPRYDFEHLPMPGERK